MKDHFNVLCEKSPEKNEKLKAERGIYNKKVVFFSNCRFVFLSLTETPTAIPLVKL